MFNIGDYVVRVSYGRDILFRITYISSNLIARLKGISYRIIADAPVTDLNLADGMRFTNQETNIMSTIQKNVERIIKEREDAKKGTQPRFQKTGTVLHIDGDAFYLNLCLKYYKTLQIPAIGEHVTESEQPKKIRALIEKYSPDILVLTGHDSLNKHHKSLYDVNEYRNSNYFIESVKRARAIKPSANELVIFAGACQSYFEGILAAGADFAASPGRVLIHALDPVFIVEKVAECPFHQVLSIEEALENTITKFNGLGGYEVIGKCRRGGPVVEEKRGITPSEKKSKKTKEGKELDPENMTEEEIEIELSKPIFTDTDEEFEEKMMIRMGNTIPQGNIPLN